MSSVVSFGTNTNAQRKRVLYTSTSAIVEGMPVCYTFDSTTNVLGIDTGASNVASSTTTEGGLNEGRFLRVEDPDADNIHAFAGVVAHGPKVGTTGTGATWLDIFIPNGAIVPVYTDQSCTLGRTILGIHSGELLLTGPYGDAGRPVAIACETNTALATTAGLVLARLDPNIFIWQQGDAAALLCDDQDSGNDFTINKIKVTSSQTTGSVGIFSVVLNTVNTDGGSAMYWEYGNTGTGAGGMKLINAYVEAAGTAIAADVVGMKIQTNLLAGSGSTTAATISAIFAKTEVKASAGTHEGAVYAGRFCTGIHTAVTGNTAQFEFEHTGQDPDYWFESVHAASVAQAAHAAGGVATNDSCALTMKVYINGTAYYIPTYTAGELNG